MAYIQRYLSLPALQVISHHDQLPVDACLLGSQVQSQSGRDKLISLVSRGDKYLSVLSSASYELSDGTIEYSCDQFDFPLRVLSWFPNALDAFRKPPVEGGLHAGSMISDYQDVDGEMLTVGSTSEGYCLTNWSRCDHGATSFCPVDLYFFYDFLYQDGFLKLWSELGDGFERGNLT